MRVLWSSAATLSFALSWLASFGNAQDVSSMGSVEDLISELPSCAVRTHRPLAMGYIC